MGGVLFGVMDMDLMEGWRVGGKLVMIFDVVNING